VDGFGAGGKGHGKQHQQGGNAHWEMIIPARTLCTDQSGA
jgi:hypothetical protein